MSEAHEHLEGQLEHLKAGFAAILPEKVAQIDRFWQRVKNDKTPEMLEAMRSVVHRFAGGTGTHGFSGLSGAARSIEAVLGMTLARGSWFSEAEVLRVDEFLQELKGALDAVADQMNSSPWGRPAAAGSAQGHESRMIYLMERDPGDVSELEQQIAVFGYMVAVFHSIGELTAAIARVVPGAVIIDSSFIAPAGDGSPLVEIFQPGAHPSPPIVFISENGEMPIRLETVRIGGTAFFLKPVDVSDLIDALDMLTSDRRQDPYRVLIVEEDFEQALYFSILLHEAGIYSSFLTNPMEIMKPLVEFQPELILMDMHMPACSGFELASVIRQQEAFVSIPILFLSSDAALQDQGLCADEVIPKNIGPGKLITSVQNRVQRFRTLRSLMERDSLTGLLKHSRIKEQLQIEVARARRQSSVFSFAMIDIDRFKDVNDSHGHLTGDRVLKSLSRLLQQRLRRIDVIGRYGGEEFAVILPNTRGDDAVRIMDDIRASFGVIRQKSDNGDFRVTFSCGISSYPLCTSALVLNEHADRALYAAKDRGRNCVVLAEIVRNAPQHSAE